MAAEGTVGLRLVVLGKAQMLAALKEVQAATHAVNAGFADGTVIAKGAAKATAAQIAVMKENAVAAAVGKRAIIGLGAAAAVVGYESIKNATVLQKNLVLLQTQAGVTAKAMKQIGSAAMANPYGATPEDFAAAAYAPTSTGFNTAASLAIVNNAQKESIISGASLIETTNSLTGAMKSYNLGAGDAAKTQAQLNAIVGTGNMHFADLNAAMSSGLMASSAQFGISIPSVGAALAFLTDRGVPAAQAGTRLRMTESLMGSPTEVSTKTLIAAGMSAPDTAGMESGMTRALQLAHVSTTRLAEDMRTPDGIFAALQDLKTHMDANGVSADMQNAAMGRIFGGGKSGVTSLMMFGNLPGLQQKYDQQLGIGNIQAFDKAFSTAMGTEEAQLKLLSSNWHKFTTSLGDGVLPGLTPLTHGLADVFGWMSQNKVAVEALGGAVSVLLVPAMGIYLFRTLAGVGGSLRALLGFYTRMAAALVGNTALVDANAASLALDDGALAANDASLVANDAALATNTASWAANDAASAGGLLSKAGGFAKGALPLVAAAGETALPIAAVVLGARAVLTSPVGGNELFGRKAWPKGLDPATVKPGQITPFPVTPTTSGTPSDGSLNGLGAPIVVQIDGKAVFTAMQNQTRARAARN